MSAIFLDALMIEGVHNGRQGIERLPFSEASFTYGNGVLENKSGRVELRRRTRGNEDESD